MQGGTKSAANIATRSRGVFERYTGWNGSCLIELLRRLPMSLVVWLPAMFVLGLGTMILCYVFIGACDKV